MNTKTLSPQALAIIDSFERFTIGSVSCSIPYFNNKVPGNRAALRVYAGKGNARDISDEVSALFIKHHVDQSKLDSESLKKFLTDSGIGIDCSGFAYYVLGEESRARKIGQIDRKLAFVDCKGITGKIRCALRPVENCSVATLADDENSRMIDIKDIQCGDMIIMRRTKNSDVRDHILIVHMVEYQNFIPAIIHYSHAVTYPVDGLYGGGIRRGTIEIVSVDRPLIDARWTEEGRQGDDNNALSKAKSSDLETRRLKWF